MAMTREDEFEHRTCCFFFAERHGHDNSHRVLVLNEDK